MVAQWSGGSSLWNLARLAETLVAQYKTTATDGLNTAGRWLVNDQVPAVSGSHHARRVRWTLTMRSPCVIPHPQVVLRRATTPCA